jgi:hypothetical protein
VQIQVHTNHGSWWSGEATMGKTILHMFILEKIFKNLLFQNQHASFNKTWYKSPFKVKGIQNCTNQGAGPSQRGDNHKNAKIG